MKNQRLLIKSFISLISLLLIIISLNWVMADDVKVWDAAKEFSAEDNPNGVWTYYFGRENGLEVKGDGTQTGLILMIMTGERFRVPGIIGWKGTMYPGSDPEIQLDKGNEENWCIIAKNFTDKEINVKLSARGELSWDWIAPVGKLILNSINDKVGAPQRTIIQFKAPKAGQYSYKATWTSLRMVPTVDIACMIYEKGYRISDLNGRMFGNNNWEPFTVSHTVNLEANDTIWFCSQNNFRFAVRNPVSLELTVTGPK